MAHWRNQNFCLGVLLDSQLTRMGFADKVKEHLAPLVWAEMVGPQVAAATEVEKVQDGVLFVSTRSAMWSQELTFHKADILRRLNERVGATHRVVITDIRFQSRGLRRRTDEDIPPPLHPSPEELADVELSARERQQIEESLTQVADPHLRDRIRRLRITDARLRTWRMDNGWAPCSVCGDLAPPRFPYDGAVNCARCRLVRQR